MAFDPFDKLAVADVGDCFFDHGKPEAVPDAIPALREAGIDPGMVRVSVGVEDVEDLIEDFERALGPD